MYFPWDIMDNVWNLFLTGNRRCIFLNDKIRSKFYLVLLTYFSIQIRGRSRYNICRLCCRNLPHRVAEAAARRRGWRAPRQSSYANHHRSAHWSVVKRKEEVLLIVYLLVSCDIPSLLFTCLARPLIAGWTLVYIGRHALSAGVDVCLIKCFSQLSISLPMM